jgi:hypothetical protein
MAVAISQSKTFDLVIDALFMKIQLVFLLKTTVAIAELAICRCDFLITSK